MWYKTYEIRGLKSLLEFYFDVQHNYMAVEIQKQQLARCWRGDESEPDEDGVQV